MGFIMPKVTLIITFLILTVGCSIHKEQIKKDYRIVSIETKQLVPELRYDCKNISFTNDKITITIHKTMIKNKVEITKKQYNLVEERTLNYDSDEAQEYCCLGFIILPVYLPYRWIQSIDRDLGEIIEDENKIVDTIEEPVEINKGYIVIEDENIKIPVINGKAIIEVSKLKLKNDFYDFKFYENDLEKLTAKIEIQYDGESPNEYLIGQEGKLNLKIFSYLGSDAAFVAELRNDGNSDIDLNPLVDHLYFILKDGMQVEGELNFYYSKYFEGNYPNLLTSNSFITFNIRTKKSVFIQNVKKCIYKIGSQKLTIELLPNTDTRKITAVSIKSK